LRAKHVESKFLVTFQNSLHFSVTFKENYVDSKLLVTS
jgi:hypothetical protein